MLRRARLRSRNCRRVFKSTKHSQHSSGPRLSERTVSRRWCAPFAGLGPERVVDSSPAAIIASATTPPPHGSDRRAARGCSRRIVEHGRSAFGPHRAPCTSDRASAEVGSAHSTPHRCEQTARRRRQQQAPPTTLLSVVRACRAAAMVGTHGKTPNAARDSTRLEPYGENRESASMAAVFAQTRSGDRARTRGDHRARRASAPRWPPR